MLHTEALSLLVGAVALGAVHGVEPGHGWPVAAAYALDRSNKWLYGLAAGLIIGVGHLVSSLAMVAVFFYAKAYFSLTRLNEPLTVVENVGVAGVESLTVGGPVSLVAGLLLVLLGIREYAGRSHAHGHAHDERESDHSHEGDHGHDDPEHAHTSEADSASSSGPVARLQSLVTGGHSHDHGKLVRGAERSLLGIAWFAFLLGFAHEEEFEIIGLCAGSRHCLELMTAYAVTVILGIVGLTMLLVAGYTQYEEKVERYTPYLPVLSAAVLVGMGLGFIAGLY